MAGPPSGSAERVNVFEVDERYLFSHYFDDETVYGRLKPYYNHQQFRFEVPPKSFEDLRWFLASRGYRLAVVDAIDDFVVAVRQYTTHPENIFTESVIQRSVDGYNCFLMTDRAAVETARRENARPLAETDLENPFR